MLGLVVDQKIIYILTPAKTASTTLRKYIQPESLVYPPTMYHANLLDLDNMIINDMLKKPDMIIILWRNPRERLLSMFKDVFDRHNHGFSSWTIYPRQFNDINKLISSKYVRDSILPHFSPVLEANIRQEILRKSYILDYKNVSKLIKDLIRLKSYSFNFDISNRILKKPIIDNIKELKIHNLRESSDNNCLYKIKDINKLNTNLIRLPRIYKYDEKITKRVQNDLVPKVCKPLRIPLIQMPLKF